MAEKTVMPALEARDLTLAWDEDSDVVRHVSLRVDPGETICIVGKSGCGKTTILHALSGLTRPREGQVLLHGRDITGKPGQVSYMLQKDLLLQSRTILDNACLPLVIGGMRPAEAREKARPLLERFGLAGVEDKWPSQLSGGMRQRAAFLRTSLRSADILLLDEPFGALDAQTRVQLQTELLETWEKEKKTCFFITHDVDEAVILAQRVIIMSARPGRIKKIVDIDIPYPRTQATKTDPRFLELKSEIWNQVYQEFLEVRK